MFVRDEVARNLISQHIRECELARAEDRRDREIAAAEVARKLEQHNAKVSQMHEENQAKLRKLEEDANSRFLKLLWSIIGVLLTAMVGLALESVKAFHS